MEYIKSCYKAKVIKTKQNVSEGNKQDKGEEQKLQRQTHIGRNLLINEAEFEAKW